MSLTAKSTSRHKKQGTVPKKYKSQNVNATLSGGGAKKSENNNPEILFFFLIIINQDYDLKWHKKIMMFNEKIIFYHKFDINKKSDHLQDAHSRK